MTAPANKRRTHNDDARAAELRIPEGTARRDKPLRRSPRGARLHALREQAADRRRPPTGPASVP